MASRRKGAEYGDIRRQRAEVRDVTTLRRIEAGGDLVGHRETLNFLRRDLEGPPLVGTKKDAVPLLSGKIEVTVQFCRHTMSIKRRNRRQVHPTAFA